VPPEGSVFQGCREMKAQQDWSDHAFEYEGKKEAPEQEEGG